MWQTSLDKRIQSPPVSWVNLPHKVRTSDSLDILTEAERDILEKLQAGGLATVAWSLPMCAQVGPCSGQWKTSSDIGGLMILCRAVFSDYVMHFHCCI